MLSFVFFLLFPTSMALCSPVSVVYLCFIAYFFLYDISTHILICLFLSMSVSTIPPASLL